MPMTEADRALTEGLWSDWRLRMFGEPFDVLHDGPDFDRIHATFRAEPEQTARMLLLGVQFADDLAAQAVAELARTGGGVSPVPTGSTPFWLDIETALRAAVPTASGVLLVHVARALYALTGDGMWAAPVVSVLGSRSHWSDRIDAALALQDFAATPALIEALAAAVRRRDYLVRYHAANTLLRYAGAQQEVTHHPELFALITAEGRTAGRQYREAARRLVAMASQS